MNTIDRQAIIDITEHPDTKNMSIITYLSILAISKIDDETGYPTISNFNTGRLYQNMKDKMSWIYRDSVKSDVKKLIRQGFLAYMDKEETVLAVLNSGSGHIANNMYYKGKGYIKFHHFFFQKIFYDLSLVAKKLTLVIAIRLDGDALEPKKINFKSKKNPDKFSEFCKMLKVNRLAHIKTALYQLKSKGVFTIGELEHNTFAFSLNAISKALIVGTDKLWNFTQEDIKKTEQILKEVNTKKFKFRHKDIQEITEAIKNNTMVFNRKVLKELCKCSRHDVKLMTGYVRSIANRLRELPLT